MELLSESLHLNALYRYTLDSSISISCTVLRELLTTTFINLAALLSDKLQHTAELARITSFANKLSKYGRCYINKLVTQTVSFCFVGNVQKCNCRDVNIEV